MEWLSEYIQETYGTCKLESCTCLKSGDAARLICNNWVKTTAKNWEELLEEAKRKKNG